MNIRSMVLTKFAVLAHNSALAVFLLLPVLLVFSGNVAAADLNQRYIRIGTSTASAVTDHTFGFNISTATSVGSISFEYCSNSPLPEVACSAPAGLDANSPAIASQSGETGFSVHGNTTSNRIVIDRVPAATTPQSNTYRFTNITNPSDSAATVYVRISTYASADGTGPLTDNGSVAFSTARGIDTTAYVPPYITFCVGILVAPDCSSTTGNAIDLGVLSASRPALGTSQFAGATNDPGGYSTAIMGITMTSGNNIIPAAANPTPSAVGASQFGINLRQNTDPIVGQNKTGIGTSNPQNGYGNQNQYKFVSGNVIADSPISTEFNVFTVSYLVNVSTNQPAGVYAATFTYIATAAF